MLRPRIKDSHSSTVRDQYRGVAVLDEDDQAIEALLRLIDGTRYLEDICHDLSRTHPGIDPNSVRDVIADLAAAGLVEEGAHRVAW